MQPASLDSFGTGTARHRISTFRNGCRGSPQKYALWATTFSACHDLDTPGSNSAINAWCVRSLEIRWVGLNQWMQMSRCAVHDERIMIMTQMAASLQLLLSLHADMSTDTSTSVHVESTLSTDLSREKKRKEDELSGEACHCQWHWQARWHRPGGTGPGTGKPSGTCNARTPIARIASVVTSCTILHYKIADRYSMCTYTTRSLLCSKVTGMC